MKDTFDRKIDYIRLSVTDRCNLRCIYCMPEAGVDFLPHDEVLSYEEILRICTQMARAGIQKIKITGGEPLVRRDLSSLVRRLKAIEGIEDVTLTTNGVLLNEHIGALVDAGISAVNISLDTLNQERYQTLTKFNCLEKVLTGIEETLKYDHLSVKLNCVPVRGAEGLDDILSLVSLAKDKRLHVRFIELMPIGLGDEMDGWTETTIKQAIENEFGQMTSYQKPLGNGPCVYYSLADFVGKIGFISAVTHKFCDKCNRIRLTSDGFLKTCLQFGTGESLKALLRAGADDDALLAKIQEAIIDKPKEHLFGEARENITDGEKKKMFRIGG